MTITVIIVLLCLASFVGGFVAGFKNSNSSKVKPFIK